MAPLNILIVGGGLAGNALASLLLLLPVPASELPHITIVERSAASYSYGQNIDVRGTGIEILDTLGVEDRVRAATTGEEGVRIVDERNRVWAEMAADKTGRVQTGTSDVEILRGRLTEILRERAEQLSKQVQTLGGRGIEFANREWLGSLEQEGDRARVVFANSGERRSYDIVVGADGLQSSTRKMVWGSEGEEGRLRRIGAYGGFFSMPKGETDSLWRRWYHAPGKKGIMVRPSDRTDRSTVFMIVVNDDDSRFEDVAKVGSRSVAGQKELLSEFFKDAGWESKRIVSEMNAADDFYYDVIAQVKMDSWSRGRVVLLGDAGYCASPFSGMGTTLALNGAHTLAGSLLQCISKDQLDYTSAFARYETKMRPLVERAQKLPPGIPHIIHPETAWGLCFMRSLIFIMSWSGISYALAMLKGPPARAIKVEDYGFRQRVEAKSERDRNFR